jgi:Berberine and berberine like
MVEGGPRVWPLMDGRTRLSCEVHPCHLRTAGQPPQDVRDERLGPGAPRSCCAPWRSPASPVDDGYEAWLPGSFVRPHDYTRSEWSPKPPPSPIAISSSRKARRQRGSGRVHRREGCGSPLDQRILELVHRWGSGRVYSNFPDAELPDWAHAYYDHDLARLLLIKATYDPVGLFRSPQSLSSP